ncbi:MAG: electron transport complex subunit RsxC [Clostridiales bacterium]|jgi:electron transport complex protein RnfC|nr:electron transport complex subunit RsxC [Clostridiales bacterium]
MSVPAFTFHRGIHPPSKKDQTAGEAVKKLVPPAGTEMIFPMLQHIGAPCEPAVSVGERVLLGQVIGSAEKPISSPVHSSVSGIVKEIRQALTPTGVVCSAVVVVNDGKDEGIKTTRAHTVSETLDREETLKLIRQAGVVGLGGAGFPTHIKLSPPPGRHIDTVIVNAAECEPYLTTDHRVLLEDTERLIAGLEIILTLFPNAQGIIGIETNKQDAIDKIEKAVREKKRISVAGLRPKYPQGAEKQLIYALTGREVPSGGLPADIGCLVDNVDTVIAVERAVHRKRPLIRRIITINGGAVKNPGNYEVRLGMTYGDFARAAGGFTTQPYKLISGGPMMGVAMFSLDVPVIKTSSAFLCLTEEEARLPSERGCIRCGRCADYCPARLMPLDLNKYVIYGEKDLFLENHGLDCIECGSCSYVCPSKRHLAQSIRAARREALAARK